MPDFLDAVRQHAAPGQITGIIEMPERQQRTSPWPDATSQRVLDALAERGIHSAWTHQAEAAQLILDGVHTVIATGTGSGKSLAAWVPALSMLADEPAAPGARDETAVTGKVWGSGNAAGRGLAAIRYRPTALYLAPTKALAADQHSLLAKLARDVSPRIGVALADGDTDAASRTWAREHASIVLSNPDFAHHVMLASHQRWAHLWRGLAVVVVDEFHSYRGMFGAHVAATLRRLLRVAAHYGARPTVVFLSATSGQPAQAAQRFLGEAFGEVRAVDDDGSPSGPKTVALWQCREQDAPAARRMASSSNTLPDSAASPDPAAPAYPADPANPDPDPADPDAELPSADAPRRAASTEAGELTGLLAAQGAQTLTFVRSRPAAERVREIARRWLAGRHPDLAESVAAYRGGYLPEERRELEDALRSGTIRALASTNALELGIDVSGLDAVVVTGWPGTHASFAQQIGRAGRAGREGLAILVGRDNPLDQYLLAHPDVLAASPMETNVFDPSNPHVLVPHICAAASELPLTEADAAIFGLADASLFAQLASDGLLRRRPAGWFWNTSLGASAHEAVSLRGEGVTVSIVDAPSGTVLGTVDSGRADTTVFPGAVYVHQGAPYRVDELAGDVALVHRDEDGLRTFAHEESHVEILSTDERIDTGIGVWARGEVLVTSRVVGYDVRKDDDGTYLGRVPLTMPVRQLHTRGTWWTINARAVADSGVDQASLPGALHAAEHAAIGILPLLATCDRWDLGGLSTAVHADTGQATVIVHDAIPGGSGCSARGFEHGPRWMRATLQALESCPCVDGCPRCVQSPKCGNNNEPLSKAGAIGLLATLVAALDGR
ncbi:MAG: DEAD/DEAH box helicase [Actinomycetaceae bacterium]|nr:DEAD/DEAH box helicase [Actinomycetaceae bacterium]